MSSSFSSFWLHFLRFEPREACNAPVILSPAFRKPRFSGFYRTDLDQILDGFRIRNLIFTGCTTSVCVDSTIRDAMFRDYRCLLLADCAGEPIGNQFSRTNHDATILTIQTVLGWISDSVSFESAVRSQLGD